jgi:hypothetical protein
MARVLIVEDNVKPTRYKDFLAAIEAQRVRT